MKTHQNAGCPYTSAPHGLSGHMTLCQVLMLHVRKQQQHICHHADDGYRDQSHSHTLGAVTDTHLSSGILYIRHYSSFVIAESTFFFCYCMYSMHHHHKCCLYERYFIALVNEICNQMASASKNNGSFLRINFVFLKYFCFLCSSLLKHQNIVLSGLCVLR